MKISDSLLPEFDQEMAGTRKTLERVPDDKLGWKPHPKSFAMGSLATHIVNMLAWTTDTIAKDSFDVSLRQVRHLIRKSRSLRIKNCWRSSTRTLLRRARPSREQATRTLLKPWSLLAGGKTLFTMPRIACIRGFVMNHTIHHRAQLGVYLRLNDIPVPSIYGPSADEGQM